jgi:hypothetical protein
MKKNDQTKNDQLRYDLPKIKKEPKNIRELLPSNILNIRKNCPLKNALNPENLPQRNFNSILEPIKLFPEWPNEEEINVKKYIKIIKNYKKL